MRPKFTQADAGKVICSAMWRGVFLMACQGISQAQIRLLFFLVIIQVMDKIVFCKDCSHKAGEHGVFGDSESTNESHPCMRSDCNCNNYVPSE